MLHSPSPTTVFSVAKRFLIPIVSWNHLYIPQNLPLEEMSKTNPEVWTHVLMRVPTWANLGHRRLQALMMLDHVSFRIPSSHLAISNPSRFVHAHFLARQFSILFHNDSCLLMSFWKGPFHHQPLWLVNLFPPLPSTKGLYHSKRHDGASGWKTLHESVPQFVK